MLRKLQEYFSVMVKAEAVAEMICPGPAGEHPALARRGPGGRCMFNVIFALGPVALMAASLAISFPGPSAGLG